MIPQYSIIIPVYNAAEWLRTTLDSVLAQTFTNWECICVDDGCKDNSGEILDEYAANDSRFVIVHQSNAGEGPARNTGLDRAKGKWIAFLDNDDIYAPSFLQDHEDLAQKYPDADMIIGARTEFTDNQQCRFDNETLNIYHSEFFNVQHYLPRCVFFGGLFLSTYRRDIHGNVRFRSCYATDIHFTADCLSESKYIVKLHKPVYGYRIRTDSLSKVKYTPWKIKGSTESAVYFLKKLSESNKSVDKFIIRNLFILWMDKQIYAIFNFLDSESEKKETYQFWCETLKEIKFINNVPIWYYIINIIIRVMPFKLISRLLCEFPQIIRRRRRRLH